jgi:hypothetical protein
MRYRIDADANMLFVVGTGLITQSERMETMLAWLHDPQFKAGLDTVCDFTTAESTPKLADLRQLIAAISDHASTIGHQKVAILAGKPITFGVARVFESMVELEEAPITVRVFFERDKLWAWLRPGQPSPE